MVMATRELEQALINAGVSQEDAQRVVDAQAARFDELATKQDIVAVKEDIEAVKADIEALRVQTRTDIHNLRRELLDRMDAMERTMWRLAWLGFAMWSATFGALMYAVFG